MILIKPKIVILTILTTLLGLSAALILLVGIDRVAGRLLTRVDYFKAMTPHVTIFWESNEFTFTSTTSSQGLRNPEVIIPKPKGTFRILALGDSFTWGWGVNLQDTWVKKLEAKLREKNASVEVINAGVYGTSLTSQLAICEDYADRFDVDMILVGFYGTDDLDQELMTKRIFETEKVWAGLRILFPAFYKIRHPTVQDSKFEPFSVYFSKDAAKKLADKDRESNSNRMEQLEPGFKTAYLEGLSILPWLDISAKNPDYLTFILEKDQFSQAQTAVAESLRKFKNFCVKDRPVIFILIPGMELVDQKYLWSRQQLGFKVDERLPTFDIDTQLLKLVQAEGFRYLSLIKNFREDGCPDCYYLWDSHLTANGNRRTAEYLTTQISPFLSSVFSDKE